MCIRDRCTVHTICLFNLVPHRVQISEENLSRYEGDFEEEVDCITEKNDRGRK